MDGDLQLVTVREGRHARTMAGEVEVAMVSDAERGGMAEAGVDLFVGEGIVEVDGKGEDADAGGVEFLAYVLIMRGGRFDAPLAQGFAIGAVRARFAPRYAAGAAVRGMP